MSPLLRTRSRGQSPYTISPFPRPPLTSFLPPHPSLSSPATPTSSLLFRHASHTPASEPLRALFPPFGLPSSQIFRRLILSSQIFRRLTLSGSLFRSLLFSAAVPSHSKMSLLYVFSLTLTVCFIFIDSSCLSSVCTTRL